MIRVEGALASARGIEAHGLRVLVDLSRLVPVAGGSAVGVALRLVDENGPGLAPGTSPFRALAEGEIGIPRGLCREAGRLACAAAEQEAAPGRGGRPAAGANEAVQRSLAPDPVLARTARALRDAVERAAGPREVLCVDPWPDGRRWAAALTHDVDVVTGWPLLSALRVTELIRRRPRLAARAAMAALGSILRDAVHDTVRHILEVERRAALRATWFVICERPTLSRAIARDVTYWAGSPAARRILESVRRLDHEIGLHGSFATATIPDLHLRQREALRRITGGPVSGVRQHFLRMDPPRTQHAMREAGFEYDASWGFADRAGFRLGLADVVPMWDAPADSAVSGLDAVPFAWMDRTASKYQAREDPEEWVDGALATAARARDAGGLWVGLWHPYLAPALGYPGAPAAFERLVGELLAHGPYMAPLEEIVSWCRSRRSLRVTATGPDGAVAVVGPEPTAGSLVLRGRDGRAVPVIRAGSEASP